MHQPLFEHRRAFAGYETRVLELEGDGPPLVLFHGFADSADTWRLLMDRLARQGRRVVAVDLPGFATATPLARDRLVLEQLVEFGAAVVRHVAGKRREPVVLCGNSLGGCLSILLAQRENLPIAGIVPLAPAGMDLARWVGIIERMPILRTLLTVPVPLPETAVREAVGRVYRILAFHDQGAIEPHIVRRFTSHHRTRQQVREFLQIARRLLPEIKRPFDLERVSCPVLLIWGDQDRLVSHHGAERFLGLVPHATYVELSGCGHCPQLERSVEVTELLLPFLAQTAIAA